MIIINEISSSPSSTYSSKECTRICHNSGCKHFYEKLKNVDETSLAITNFSLYKKNIKWLKNNPFGLSYAEMNLLVYVILFPLISILLLIRLLKK